jgi:hypothetical protein
MPNQSFQKPMITKTNQHNPPDKPPPTIPASAFICVHLRLKISSLRGKTKPNHYFEQKETKETKILNTFEINSVFPRVNIYMFPNHFSIFVPFVAFCSKNRTLKLNHEGREEREEDFYPPLPPSHPLRNISEYISW